MMTDSTGHFSIPAVPPGRYALQVARIGYVRRVDSVEVGAGGLAVEATLRVLMTDACPGNLVVRQEKPWWKWW